MNQRLFIPAIALVVFVCVAIILFRPVGVDALITNELSNYRTYEFFDSSSSSTIAYQLGTTTSATSTDVSYIDSSGRVDRGFMNVAGAKAVTVFFSRSSEVGANSGTSTFKIQISDDGSTWMDYNKLRANTANNTMQLASTSAISGTTTAVYSLDVDDAFMAIRCVVIETTDGRHRCRAAAKF